MRSKRNLTLAICCGTHAVQDGLSATLYVLLPVLAEAFGLNLSQIGIVRATKNAATTLFELPSGILSEWTGERKLVVFGLVCAGCGYVFLAQANGLWMVLLALFVVGTGTAFHHALSSSIISEAFGDGHQRSALGLYNSSGDAGKLAFTGLFSLAVGLGLAWQNVVTGFGLIALVFATAALLAMRGMDVGGHRPARIDENGNARPAGWGIRDRNGFLALCLTIFLDAIVQAGFLTFLAFFIAARGVPTNLAAFAVVLTLIGGMFGKAGGGFLAERIGVGRSFLLMQCATAIGIMALLALPVSVGFVILPAIGVFLQGSTSITYSSVNDVVHGERKSRAFAMIYSVTSLSAIVGPILFGLLGDLFGLAPTMLAMAAVSVLAIFPGLALRARTA